MEQSNKPNEESIKEVLGNAYEYFTKLITLTKVYNQDWTFTKNSGWMLKIFDKKKSLLYIIPLKEGFKVSLAIRETERELLLKDKSLEMHHAQLAASRKYMEGYALQFEIFEANEYQQFQGLISKLLIIRSS
jgi:hypothetical protein